MAMKENVPKNVGMCRIPSFKFVIIFCLVLQFVPVIIFHRLNFFGKNNNDCVVTINESLDAISRAKTDQCKSVIHDFACRLQEADFTPSEVQKSCPLPRILNFQPAKYAPPTRPSVQYGVMTDELPSEIYAKSSVRIVFLVILSGRDVRQVRRMMKMIYTPHHYYLVHVDARDDFMFREMIKLEEKLSPIGNFHIRRSRYSTVWGGYSMMEMVLDTFQNLTLGTLSAWKWDFVLNLSETDFPIATIPELEALLSRYKGLNFLKDHGHPPKHYIAIQGVDQVFVQCEGRMWRLGQRNLPTGLRVSGGSEWFAMGRKFINFATNSEAETRKRILKVWRHIMLPGESYFHSLAQTTEFCDQIINTDLKYTNWNHVKGCQCQHKHVVDWCIPGQSGCSPNVIKETDWPKIQSYYNKRFLQYFGRKFESVIDQRIITKAETQALNGNLSPFSDHLSFDHFWLNLYNNKDSSPNPDPALLIFMDLLGKMFQKQLTTVCNDCVIQNPTDCHIFRKSDKDNLMIVTKFDTFSDQGNVQFEVLSRRNVEKNPGEVGNTDYSLDSVDIGTKYDVKEEIFRNYIGVFGEDARPIVRHIWSKLGLHALDTFNITVKWIDPLGQTQSTVNHTVSMRDDVEHTEYELPAIRTPGIWTVKLSTDQILQEISFPVFGEQSKVDLVENFYEIVDFCLVREGAEKFPFKDKFKSCQETFWSSVYPDPKSEILYGYNETIGWLL